MNPNHDEKGRFSTEPGGPKTFDKGGPKKVNGLPNTRAWQKQGELIARMDKSVVKDIGFGHYVLNGTPVSRAVGEAAIKMENHLRSSLARNEQKLESRTQLIKMGIYNRNGR